VQILCTEPPTPTSVDTLPLVPLLTRIRAWLVLFITGLVLSGVTAFPLETELRLLADLMHASPVPEHLPGLAAWIDRVHAGLAATGRDYPFIAYGSDWLAFAHLVIAIAFVGPLRDPVRNIWVVQFGMIACVAIIPLALIAGPIRGIPIGWQLIDMSFGVVGIIPLLIVYRDIRRLERSAPADAVPGRAVGAVRGQAVCAVRGETRVQDRQTEQHEDRRHGGERVPDAVRQQQHEEDQAGDRDQVSAEARRVAVHRVSHRWWQAESDTAIRAANTTGRAWPRSLF
jgi:hypothetical protein